MPSEWIPSSFVTRILGHKENPRGCGSKTRQRLIALLPVAARCRWKTDPVQRGWIFSLVSLGFESNGRDDWIRTSDLFHPKEARYQAAPRPVPIVSVLPGFNRLMLASDLSKVNKVLQVAFERSKRSAHQWGGPLSVSRRSRV